MKIFKMINNYGSKVKRTFKHVENIPKSANSFNNHDENDPEKAFFDGMGLVTATDIVKERIDEKTINEYGIEELENKGRYYIARVREANGGGVHTMLIDKQNGMVRSLYRKSAKRMPS